MIAFALLLLASPDPEAVRQAIIARCGIAPGRIAVEPQGDPPEGMIVIKGSAPLKDRQIGCFGTVLAETGGIGFSIDDDAIGERYEVLRKREMLAGARGYLRWRGLLRRVPVYRPQRESLAMFAHRLERLCGAPPGSVLRVEEGMIRLQDHVFAEGADPDFERTMCVFNASIVAGFDPLTIPLVPVPLPELITPAS
ncbi:MAG: hypothetical protein ACAH11_01945 [Sphingomonas sp.]